MHEEACFKVTQSGRGPVVAVSAAHPLQHEQRWHCAVCGQEMAYSQPLALSLAVGLLNVFIDHHAQKCGEAFAQRVVQKGGVANG